MLNVVIGLVNCEKNLVISLERIYCFEHTLVEAAGLALVRRNGRCFMPDRGAFYGYSSSLLVIGNVTPLLSRWKPSR